MKRARRIIPVSSGKGGVGKTTLAINYALSLSRHGRTVLIDVDTGTSSVRNCIDTPVSYDLYHFFKKRRPLADCMTTLSQRLDPEGRFRNFGFVAAPRHLIEDITNFNRSRREQLIDAINTLQADFVILDLKAGLDSNVIEFLPYSNSGILVFTPHLPAATMAAADIVKGILFRKLRAIFAKGSPIYAVLEGVTPRGVNNLIDRVEDVYDSSVHNLDAFAAELHRSVGEHPVVELVRNVINYFKVHFVLNMFNGVKDSYETAIKPFVSNLAENVSAHLTINNLGWIMAHDEINQANIRRVPVVLEPERQRARDPQQALQHLAAQYLPRRTAASRGKVGDLVPPPDPSHYLEEQLDTLKRMHADLKGTSYRDNFRYIIYRSLHLMESHRVSDLGDTRLFKPSEFQRVLAERRR